MGSTSQECDHISYAQSQSRLFRLPQELRDDIYHRVLASTRLSHGIRQSCCNVRMKPAPNSLAVLRVCRRTREEIGDRWLREVLFSFENIISMLDKLTAIPRAMLTEIRHVRVGGKSLWVEFPAMARYFNLHAAFKLLPGLRLDTLTVLGFTPVTFGYETVNELIAKSDGWRELRFVSHNSVILGFGFSTRHARWEREPQPSFWREVLSSRDGPSASVSVYRSSLPGTPGSVFEPATRDIVEQTIPEGVDREDYAISQDAAMMEEPTKELLIVARRGQDAEYEESGGFAAEECDDVRLALPNMTWREIKRAYIDVCWAGSESDGDSAVDLSGPDLLQEEVDEYSHVDEYGWTEAHRKEI